MRALLLAALAVVACRPLERSHDLPREFGEQAQAIRPDSPSSQPPRFETSDTVDTVASPASLYRIHFSRSGPNAVPADDLDHNGVPDFVDTVASTYDRVLALYVQLGYRKPPDDSTLTSNGGDGLFDVYLVDFGGHSDGAYRQEQCFSADKGCAGYMVQENDFAGYGYPSLEEAIEILASHEMFHGVQAAYNANEGSVAAEGTAVWATERFNPALRDFEGFIGAYLERPDKTLTIDPVGPVQDFSYGSALFFQFLSEKFGDEIIRKLWEDCVPGAQGVADPQWRIALDALLQREYSSSLPKAFAEFARWNLFTSSRADPTRSYARGAGYEVVATEAKTFPADASARLALASARYFLAPPDGRTHFVAEWVSSGEPPVGVQVTLATLKSRKVVTLQSAENRVELDATAADSVVFSAANIEFDGASQVGFLCAGTADEVATCKASHTETPDAGIPTPPVPVKKGGCTSLGAPWLALLGLLGRRRGRPAVP